MFNKEPVFKIPDIARSREYDREPPAVRRHYIVIRNAMAKMDRKTVANRQIRLLRSGFEIPVTLKQCDKLLEKYVTQSSQ